MSLVNRQTRPDIQLNIATYKLNGQLDCSGADELIKRVDNHLSILRGMRIEGVLLSFKGITKIDKESLFKVIKYFSMFHVKLRCVIGFCDYSSKIYPVLKQLVKSSPLGLYKNMDVMALAIGTSNASVHTSVLVYSDNVDERQAIASTLISNNYFVIMAVTAKDFEKKSSDKDRFDRFISDSYFSNIHEDVTISFEKNIFSYEFQGTLDNTISKRVNIDDFQYRLSLGYTVIVLDFTNIYHMNLRAAYFILELLKIAEPYNVLTCCVELNSEKIDNNALGILDKCPIWIFDTHAQVYEDPEVIAKISSILPSYSTGISKELLAFIPLFITASMQSLEIYEIPKSAKGSPKQVKVNALYAIKPTIISHITFSGDFEGELFFLYTKPSVNTLIKHILVDFDDYVIEDYLDAMTEFVNSVTGKLKSNIRKNYKCIQFGLPQSSTLIQDFISDDTEQSFILTKFQCNENDYYVALSSPVERT